MDKLAEALVTIACQQRRLKDKENMMTNNIGRKKRLPKDNVGKKFDNKNRERMREKHNVGSWCFRNATEKRF